MDPIKETLEIFTQKEIVLYQDIYEKVKNKFIDDYGLDDFTTYYIDAESPTMKAISHRFYIELLGTNFFQVAEQAIKNNRDEGDVKYLRHPMYWARTAYPTNTSKQKLLDAYPHYDRTFMIRAYSMWLALSDANTETGGLCFFKKSKQMTDLFNIEWGSLGKFNPKTYSIKYKELDPTIEGKIIYPNLNAGQAYLFNSYTLHGSTWPMSKKRLSFDCRFITNNNFLEASPLAMRIIEAFNRDPLDVISKNMFLAGDYIGANRINSKIESSFSKDTINEICDITVRDQKISWRIENSFIQ